MTASFSHWKLRFFYDKNGSRDPFWWSKMKKMDFSWFHTGTFDFHGQKTPLFLEYTPCTFFPHLFFMKTWKNTFFHHAFPSSMSVQNKKHGVKTIWSFFWKNFFSISWRRLFTEFIRTLETSLAQNKMFSHKILIFHVNLFILDRIFPSGSEMCINW